MAGQRQTFSKSEKLTVLRINVVQLISTLLVLNQKCVEIATTKSGLLSACIDTLFSYKWNNIVHCQASKIITTILMKSSSKLKYWLFAKYKLLDKIAEFKQEPFKNETGYQGHIVDICIKVLKAKETNARPGTYFNKQLIQFIEKNYDWDKLKEWINKQIEIRTPWEKPKPTPVNVIMSQLSALVNLFKQKK